MTALFSTAYFPPVQYVATLLQYVATVLQHTTEPLQHKTILVEAKETFPKQTYRNRMEIMTAGGVRTLTVPVIRSNHSRTDEVLIDYMERWNIIHLRTLAAAYSASPYYLYYQDDIERLLTIHYDRLIDLNQAILAWLAAKLKMPISLELTTDYVSAADLDYRNAFSPKRRVAADGFREYCQVFSDRQPFVHNLSILDLLMNLGPEARDYCLSV